MKSFDEQIEELKDIIRNIISDCNVLKEKSKDVLVQSKMTKSIALAHGTIDSLNERDYESAFMNKNELFHTLTAPIKKKYCDSELLNLEDSNEYQQILIAKCNGAHSWVRVLGSKGKDFFCSDCGYHTNPNNNKTKQ